MEQPTAHIHAIGTAVPPHDIHKAFVDWAAARLADPHEQALFRRMAGRSGIAHRWSILPRADNGGSPVEPGGFYYGNRMPPTSKRMELYARAAPDLAIAAISALGETVPVEGVTHIVLASCTGFVAPGIDQIIIERLGLDPSIERTVVGFMGCYAAVSALRVAHHIVRSQPDARVLVITIELSTLHLGNLQDIESMLAALQFGDGAAAAIVSSEPSGFAIDRFFCASLPNSSELIGWTIGDEGFAMTLSGKVPGRIANALHDPKTRARLLGGRSPRASDWAVHAGGRSILEAVEHGLGLAEDALDDSRAVLEACGNMSSATLMFVLARMLESGAPRSGIALAFGPGMAAEGFDFTSA